MKANKQFESLVHICVRTVVSGETRSKQYDLQTPLAWIIEAWWHIYVMVNCAIICWIIGLFVASSAPSTEFTNAD